MASISELRDMAPLPEPGEHGIVTGAQGQNGIVIAMLFYFLPRTKPAPVGFPRHLANHILKKRVEFYRSYRPSKADDR